MDVTSEQGPGPQPTTSAWVVWAVCGAVAVLAVGWIVLGLVVLRAGVIDAVSQAVGVACGLFLLVAVIGRAFQARRRRRA